MAVIDCIRTSGSEPGSVYKASIDDLKKSKSADYSLHQLEFLDSVNLISLMSRIPETIIFGIKPFEIESLSLNFQCLYRLKFEAFIKK